MGHVAFLVLVLLGLVLSVLVGLWIGRRPGSHTYDEWGYW